MHGQHYSGSLFFHINGKQNNFKDSLLLGPFVEEEGEESDLNDDIINIALPIIQNSITDDTNDPGASIADENLSRTYESKCNNTNINDRLNINSSSYQTSIDCDEILEQIPKIKHNLCTKQTQNRQLKRKTQQSLKHQYDAFKLSSNINTKNIHQQSISKPKLNMFAISATSPEEEESESESDVDLSSLQTTSIQSTYPINPKSFKPDILNIDRTDNNSYRCEYVYFDEDWWINSAFFDDNIEFEYDTSPYFIYYGVEV